MNAVNVVPPELKHEQARPGLSSSMQRLQVSPLNLFVIQEYMVEGAVYDGVEPILEPIESCCIRYPEVDHHPATPCVALGSVDRRGGAVNARCCVALGRVVDRVMAQTRPRVEYVASEDTV